MERRCSSLKLKEVLCALIGKGALYALIGTVCSCYAISVAQAQTAEPPAAAIQLAHTPPDPAQLPAPGLPITLTVRINNSKRLDLPIKAMIVRDGRLMVAPLPTPTYNTREEPVYTLQTFAPQAEINYRFVITTPEGNSLSTKSFLLRRSCLPSIEAADFESSEELQGTQRLEALIRHSKNLERDITAYQEALKLIAELKEITRR